MSADLRFVTLDGEWRVDVLLVDGKPRFRVWWHGTLKRTSYYNTIEEVQAELGDRFADLVDHGSK